MTRIPSRSIRPFSLAAAVAGLIVLLIPAPHVLAKLAPVQQTAPVPVVTNIPVAAPEIRSSMPTYTLSPTQRLLPSRHRRQLCKTSSRPVPNRSRRQILNPNPHRKPQ